MRVLNMTLDTFAHKETKFLAEIIKKYVAKYRNPPTKDTLEIFANDLATEKTIESIGTVLADLEDLPKIQATEAEFYFQKAEQYRIGRGIYDLNQFIHDRFTQNEGDFKAMRQKILSMVLSSGIDFDHIRRGFVYENVEERFKIYEKAESGEKTEDLIPFGIQVLDKNLGGMKKSFVVLMYSKTGGGKTRTAINIAYNAAQAGYRVMFFTLEMAFNEIANCFASRTALVNSQQIQQGKLSIADKHKFFRALKDQARDKLGVWLVDVPRGARPSTILEELEMYKAVNGFPPDIVVIDYANLMEPTKAYIGRSEKYDLLFQEFHEIARFENVVLLTATQEKRIGKTGKKKDPDEEDELGVENIGLSHYMAPHCEIILRLKQDKHDRMQNRLWAIVDKHRYAKPGEQIMLKCYFDLTYVGDGEPSPLKLKKTA